LNIDQGRAHVDVLLYSTPLTRTQWALLVFWPYSVFGQNHLCIKMRKHGFHLQSDVSRFCLQVRRISRSLSAVRTIEPSRLDAHLSTVPSIRTTCHSVRMPDSPASSVRTTCSFRPDPCTVSRSFCSSLVRPDVSAARPDAYQFSNGSLILSKFQEREDQATVRMMWYPAWMRVSIRQELQFKIDRSDV
jgi:hypothetical protein